MDLESNNIALYLFLFLSLLSVGNDFYQVYLTTLETEFIKKQKEKFSTYYEIFENVLCNNVKKVKNKLILNSNEINKNNSNQENKNNSNQENKNNSNEINKDIEKKKKKKQKKIIQENNIIDEKNNNEYEKNINILKTIVKKEKINKNK